MKFLNQIAIKFQAQEVVTVHLISFLNIL